VCPATPNAGGAEASGPRLPGTLADTLANLAKPAVLGRTEEARSIAGTNGPDAAAVVESKGSSVKRPSVRTKRPFQVVRRHSPCSVTLPAKGTPDRAVRGRRYGTDRTTSMALGDTPQSSTTHPALALLTVSFFQHRMTTKDGPCDWGSAPELALG